MIKALLSPLDFVAKAVIGYVLDYTLGAPDFDIDEYISRTQPTTLPPHGP